MPGQFGFFSSQSVELSESRIELTELGLDFSQCLIVRVGLRRFGLHYVRLDFVNCLGLHI
jgi:hypothetical protein